MDAIDPNDPFDPRTDAYRIATAVNWALNSQLPGIPQDLIPADATITRHPRHRSVPAGGGDGSILTWVEYIWTVTLRGQWAVDLDSGGVPKGPPRRIR